MRFRRKCLLVICILTYIGTLGNLFVNWDDLINHRDNNSFSDPQNEIFHKITGSNNNHSQDLSLVSLVESSPKFGLDLNSKDSSLEKDLYLLANPKNDTPACGLPKNQNITRYEEAFVSEHFSKLSIRGLLYPVCKN